mmetsp:Transcript_665/g.1554  ORF Transcript_665/g.1554 Transcript_665/m.1554 type:complete len:233 (+) Transcript_665:127-825(+)
MSQLSLLQHSHHNHNDGASEEKPSKSNPAASTTPREIHGTLSKNSWIIGASQNLHQQSTLCMDFVQRKEKPCCRVSFFLRNFFENRSLLSCSHPQFFFSHNPRKKKRMFSWRFFLCFLMITATSNAKFATRSGADEKSSTRNSYSGFLPYPSSFYVASSNRTPFEDWLPNVILLEEDISKDEDEAETLSKQQGDKKTAEPVAETTKTRFFLWDRKISLEDFDWFGILALHGL